MMKITGSLTIYRAEEIRQSLMQELAKGGEIELDTSEVTAIDAGGLQLLSAALGSARARKIVLHFESEERMGPVVREAWETAGFESDGADSDLGCRNHRTHGDDLAGDWPHRRPVRSGPRSRTSGSDPNEGTPAIARS